VPDAANTTSLIVVPKARRTSRTVSRSTRVRLTDRRGVIAPLSRVRGAVSGVLVPAARWDSQVRVVPARPAKVWANAPGTSLCRAASDDTELAT
jgi:hypothetical protein